MADSAIPPLAQNRVAPLTRIRRERLLPMRGEVTATIGSRVDPLDVVARANATTQLRPVPLARYLQVPEGALSKYLLKKVGDPVTPREIIASKPLAMGTLQRVYRAPGTGRISAIQGSWLTLELTDAPFDLQALYRGTVVNVMPRLGVVLEAVGTLVQGLWGTGGEGYGVLKKMVDARETMLTEDKLDVSARGAVLLAGAGVTREAMQRAAQERAAGLIVGGLAPALKEFAVSLGLPILVTDGFGERPMSPLIFDLLASHHGEETSLNTATRTRGGTLYPEAFIPAVSTGATAESAGALSAPAAQIGTPVRVIGGAHAGEIGKIKQTPETPRPLESGVSAWGAEIELTSGEQTFAPWENLELIG